MKIKNVRIDNTQSVRDKAFSLQLEYSNNSGMPLTKRGNDGKSQFQKGDKVITTGKGIVKSGIEYTIENCYKENGYLRYTVTENSIVFHKDDFIKA